MKKQIFFLSLLLIIGVTCKTEDYISVTAPEILWQKTFGGSSFDYANSIIETGDGYIFAGATECFGAGENAAYLVKIGF